jgi:hypothetical protein
LRLYGCETWSLTLSKTEPENVCEEDIEEKNTIMVMKLQRLRELHNEKKKK